MLTVKFSLDPALQDALASFREENAPRRVLIVTVDDEVMRLHGKPVEATGNMETDLAKVREILTTDKLAAAFIIVKLREGESAQISFCPDNIKPKIRLLYSAGAGHLSDATKLAHLMKEHVTCVQDIKPSLFAEETTSSRAELMTEKEKVYAAIEKMELAPMPVVMPGVTMPIIEEGLKLLDRFNRGELSALTFLVDANKIQVEKELSASNESLPLLLSTVKELLPEEHPRFVVLRCPSEGTPKTFMVYICPLSCTPREKMIYSSSKSSFVSLAEQHGVTFFRRLEVEGVDELMEAVSDAINEDLNKEKKE